MTDTGQPSEKRYVPAASTVAFVGALCFRFPQLQPLLAEHLQGNLGQVLPYIFLDDVRRWIMDRVEQFGASDSEAKAVLDFCDEVFAKTAIDDDLCTLIAIEIVESLRQDGDAGRKVIAMFGPQLRDETARQDNWRPGQS
ncbi:DUF7674 family protein [Hypericibacter sp.]|uniref:DUF7674 family protein n=1 Tax=Hypericibacter sp. TaxID=2705401 RepID=UPI003D6C9D13